MVLDERYSPTQIRPQNKKVAHTGGDHAEYKVIGFMFHIKRSSSKHTNNAYMWAFLVGGLYVYLFLIMDVILSDFEK